MRPIPCAPAVRGLPVRGALLTAAAALLLSAPAVAPAQAAPPEPYQGNWVYVSVTDGEARSAAPAEARGTLLLCDPPQAAGHRETDRACAELARAGGDPTAIPARADAVCPMRYAPVTARARGEWGGRPVQYTETFPNACVMTARTGDVFTLAGTTPAPAPAQVPAPE
ncbi:SSI family serine proteinase inhibitor [Streptomyces abyssomicinicus]|uniref:SSI family serine proteinase inhibitor n=1 Tax=Streptomyces abyssomicinicus TaxID=574929 RepID=UPI00124FC300|nr:SSI family serine proteinase inhibitor [Streptomyces abyssomicinicus]